MHQTIAFTAASLKQKQGWVSIRKARLADKARFQKWLSWLCPFKSRQSSSRASAKLCSAQMQSGLRICEKDLRCIIEKQNNGNHLHSLALAQCFHRIPQFRFLHTLGLQCQCAPAKTTRNTPVWTSWAYYLLEREWSSPPFPVVGTV